MRNLAEIGFVINVVVNAIHMFLVGFLTGAVRNIYKVPASNEDAKFYGKKGTAKESGEPLLEQQQQQQKQNDSVGEEKVQRVRRIHQNHLENIPTFFLCAAAFVFAQGNPIAGLVIMSIFTIARLLYTITYFFALQPWRTICFFLGNICMVVIGIWAIVAAFL